MGAPVNPGDLDVGRRRLRRHVRRRRRPRRQLPPAHRLHARERRRRADADRAHLPARQAARPPRPQRRRCSPARARSPARATAANGSSAGRTRSRSRGSRPPALVSLVRARHSFAGGARPSCARGRARCRSGRPRSCRSPPSAAGWRAMTFGHPLALLSLLVIPPAVGGLPARRAAADAVRSPLHEPRRARVGRRRLAVAPARRADRLPARARVALCRGRAAVRAPHASVASVRR